MSYTLTKKALFCTTAKANNNGITPGAKLVLIALASYANDKGEECWPSMQTIASVTGYTRRGVINYINELEAKNLIQKESANNSSNDYRLMYKEWSQMEVTAGRVSIDGEQRSVRSSRKKPKEVGESNPAGSEQDLPVVVNVIHQCSEQDSLHCADDGGEQDSPPVVNSIHHGSEQDSPVMVNGVHTNKPMNKPMNQSVEKIIDPQRENAPTGPLGFASLEVIGNNDLGFDRQDAITEVLITESISPDIGAEIGGAPPMGWNGTEPTATAVDSPVTQPAVAQTPGQSDEVEEFRLDPLPNATEKEKPGKKKATGARATNKFNFDKWNEPPSPEAWSEYEQLRIKKKATITQRIIDNIGLTMNRIIRDYEVNGTDTVVDLMVERGWLGLHYDWVDRYYRPRGNAEYGNAVNLGSGVTIDSVVRPSPSRAPHWRQRNGQPQNQGADLNEFLREMDERRSATRSNDSMGRGRKAGGHF